MSKWNGKRFSVYESEEKQVLGLIKGLGERTNYNTDELEQVKKSDNKKVSYDDLHTKYQLTTDGTNANFNGTWQGLKRPTLSEEGAFAQVEKNADDIKEICIKKYKLSPNDIPDINQQFENTETPIPSGDSNIINNDAPNPIG